MAVIISFMEQFEENLSSGEKSRTNRAYSRSRNRISVGERVQIYIANRTKKAKKLFDAIIISKKIWHYDQAPLDPELAATLPSPKELENWREFAIKDGFTEFQEFIDYFDPEKHPKKKAKYIFFEFQKVDEYYSKTYHSLEVFIER